MLIIITDNTLVDFGIKKAFQFSLQFFLGRSSWICEMASQILGKDMIHNGGDRRMCIFSALEG